MSQRAKIATILICFSLCGAGGFIASTAHEKTEPQGVNTTPVKNREVVQRIWVQV
jgi:hypothetical protein